MLSKLIKIQFTDGVIVDICRKINRIHLENIEEKFIMRGMVIQLYLHDIVTIIQSRETEKIHLRTKN